MRDISKTERFHRHMKSKSNRRASFVTIYEVLIRNGTLNILEYPEQTIGNREKYSKMKEKL